MTSGSLSCAFWHRTGRWYKPPYIFRYPNESEWFADFQQLNASYNGDLPGSGISVFFIRVMNTVASGMLMVAMGLATDTSVLVETIKSPALTVIGIRVRI